MSKYHTPKEYQDAAKSIDTSKEELRVLASSEYSFVRDAVAGNPNTESDVLSNLIPEVIESRDDQSISLKIVKNPNTELEAYISLAKRLKPLLDNGRDHHLAFEAGVLLCKNPLIPIEVITTLLNPEIISKQFRKVVARETDRQDVLEILVMDKSEIVRRRAIKTINLLAVDT